VVQMGQKVEMTEDQIKDIKASAGTVAELTVPEGASIVNVEKIQGEDAYAVKVSDKVTEYYSVDSGLKLQTKTVVEQMGQTFESTINYKDYKAVDGIMMPFTLEQSFGPQQVGFKMEEIMINEGVDDADFE